MKKLKDFLGKVLFIAVVADGTYHIGYAITQFLYGFHNGLFKKKNEETESD